MNRDERRRAGAVHEQLAHAVPGRFRRDHGHVDVRPDLDPAEADVEAVREQEQLAGRQMRRDRVAIDLRLCGVGDQHHDDVGPRGDIGDVTHGERRGLRFGARRARRVQTDAHRDAAVLQVQRVGVPLRSVADDPNLLRPHDRQIGVGIVVHLGHHSLLVVGELVTW